MASEYNRQSFHIEEMDGVRAGDVWRLSEHLSYNNATVLGISSEGNALVARPYAYVSSAGTCRPTPLLGAEVYSLPVKHITRYGTKVATAGMRKQ